MATIQVTLSGGAFGGDVVDVDQTQLQIIRTNDQGDWVYDRATQQDTTAVFTQLIPPTPTP
jgi:hypothetical protein